MHKNKIKGLKKKKKRGLGLPPKQPPLFKVVGSTVLISSANLVKGESGSLCYHISREVMLASLSVYFETLLSFLWDLERAIWIDLVDSERTWPSCPQFARKEFESRVEKQHHVSYLEFSSSDSLVMPCFGAFFVHLGIVVCIESHFVEFMEVEDSLFTGWFNVEVQPLDCPRRFVF